MASTAEPSSASPSGESYLRHFLSEQHQQALIVESGISPAVIAQRAYHTAQDKAELVECGFTEGQASVPALCIPVFGADGARKTVQIRPDHPRSLKGKPVKYETPAGSRMAFDIHPSVTQRLATPDERLWITEGVKKGDALVSRGECAMALLGVWNWRGTNPQGGKTVLPEWEFVALNGREVLVVFDSDVMTKPAVTLALDRLSGFLSYRGARVKLVFLPHG